MRRTVWRMVCLALVGGALWAGTAPAHAERRVDYMFVISVDGFAPRYFDSLAVPNIRSLADGGSWSEKALTVEPPLTLPATASMVSGVSVKLHRIDWDAWQPPRGTIRVKTIFSEARKAGLTTAAFFGERKLEHLATEGTLDYYETPGASDQVIMERVLLHLRINRNSPYNLYFIQLPGTEWAGLRYGWGSQQYLAAIEEADTQIGRLLSWIAGEGLSARSAMLVTSDHGGEDMTHESVDDACMRIPWVLCGPGVRQGYQILDDVSTLDTAKVTLTMLDVPIPEQWEGRIPPKILTFAN